MTTRTSDIVAILSKGVLGAFPFVGPLAAEVVGAIIPNQRLDRIEVFLKKLEEKISGLDQEKIKQKFMTAESVDLLEDGFYQVSRALTDERKDYIAALIKNSLTDEQLQHIEYKKLLSILGQVNDIEILILIPHTLYRGNPEYSEFMNKHESTLTAPLAHLGSGQDEIDKATIYQTYRDHLVDLRLLRRRFKKLKKGEVPEFDEKTGMIKGEGYEITPLGRLLLRSIDQGGTT